MYEHTYIRVNMDILIPKWPFIRMFRPNFSYKSEINFIATH